jgi:hypothetical protein
MRIISRSSIGDHPSWLQLPVDAENHPCASLFAVNFLAGMTKMSLKRFILTTAVDVFPGSVVYTYAGQQFGTIRSVDDIMTPNLFIAFLLLGILALLPVVLRFLKRDSLMNITALRKSRPNRS